MANERLLMTKIKQVVRLHMEGVSIRKISEMLGISRDSASKYLSVVECSGLACSEIKQMTDSELWNAFDKDSTPDKAAIESLIASFPDMQKRLTKTGMTRLRLWSEYKTKNPYGIIIQVPAIIFKSSRKASTSMHFEQKAGDNLLVKFTQVILHFVEKAI
jgi:hypothetical protein